MHYNFPSIFFKYMNIKIVRTYLYYPTIENKIKMCILAIYQRSVCILYACTGLDFDVVNHLETYVYNFNLNFTNIEDNTVKLSLEGLCSYACIFTTVYT